jgi:hypothetical protein
MTDGGSSLRRLAEFYAELGRQVAAHADLDDVLGAVAQVAVETVPGAEYASISRGRGEGLETVAWTDPVARTADRLQFKLGAGPCVDAVTKDGLFLTGHLAADPRWPTFGPIAGERLGLQSVLSLRMLFENDQLAAGLNLYSRNCDAFAETSATVGRLLATHSALAISLVGAQQKADHLTKALDTNREIGIAIGVLMFAHKVTREQAFNLLRIVSQHSHRKLFDIARDVIDTGSIDLPRY